MATQSPVRQSDGPSLRPRVVDVAEEDYATVTSLVSPNDTAYFERKAGDVTLVIQ